MVVALILAGGKGARFNSKLPKQYHRTNSGIILNDTVQKFLNHPLIKFVQVVINPEHKDLFNELITPHPKLLPCTFGGDTRQQSALLGLKSLEAINPKKVLIHDAVRPYISELTVTQIINKLDTYKAVDLAIPVTDTIKMQADSKISTLDRSKLYSTQTPQGFIYQDILTAHENAKSNFTDCITLMLERGYDVAVVNGEPQNIKITYKTDSPKTTRIGSGFDVHKFSLEPNCQEITLGGIKIPYNYSLLAHSDGDVVLHAVTDAILGALAKGDIGEHFPPSDSQWKNINSSVFLKAAIDMLLKEGGIINNIDVTIICQKPHISEYRKTMRRKIAQIMNIDESQISIKATTTEGLGFTGRKEGIAVQATCLISI